MISSTYTSRSCISIKFWQFLPYILKASAALPSVINGDYKVISLVIFIIWESLTSVNCFLSEEQGGGNPPFLEFLGKD